MPHGISAVVGFLGGHPQSLEGADFDSRSLLRIIATWHLSSCGISGRASSVVGRGRLRQSLTAESFRDKITKTEVCAGNDGEKNGTTMCIDKFFMIGTQNDKTLTIGGARTNEHVFTSHAIAIFFSFSFTCNFPPSTNLHHTDTTTPNHPPTSLSTTTSSFQILPPTLPNLPLLAAGFPSPSE